MRQETKICQNCQKGFTIEPEDFDFYEKVKVPPPTFCPECRAQRRMAFFNERILYKRKDSKTGEIIFSGFSDDKDLKIYDHQLWWSDEWDAMDYGQDYDFNKPFFSQFLSLLKQVPLASRSFVSPINSEYCNNAGYLKNCYLVFDADNCDNVLYSCMLHKSKDTLDIYYANNIELCYDSFMIWDCSRVFFSSYCDNCLDVYFSKNLTGCNNCFGCMNLRNKKYYIFNKPYSKEDYQTEIKKFNFSSYGGLQKIINQARSFWLKFPVKFREGTNNVNVSGEYIADSKNVINSYDINGCRDLKFCQIVIPPASDCYDYTDWGLNADRIYESSMCGRDVSRISFCWDCYKTVSDSQYCFQCHNSHNLFACIGLRNKQYCILNKQYAKEEYEAFIPKIIEHMNSMPYQDKKGRIYKYGEFFPTELSPFCYNETIAQEFFPLTKEQAMKQGYSWRDPEPRNYQIDIKTEDLPDNIRDVSGDIVGKVIECQHKGTCNEQCTEAFRLIPQELAFYRRMNLPLPCLCPNCRHYQRLKQRNPLKLWTRQCMHEGCPNTFETSYAPDRPEIIYCEACYLKEVV
ncbi:MAG: hypothetical protein AAB723_04435 [Patescibacteria group bacterium]